MKQWIAILVLLMLAAPAMAQLVGLPIADGAGAPDARLLQASAGIQVGDDVNMYGGRATFAPMDALSIFADVGLVDWDSSAIKLGYGGQVGALYSLPLDLPVDLGVRVALGAGRADLKRHGNTTWFTLNSGVLASLTIDRFTPYAFVGINYINSKISGRSVSRSHDDTDPALGGGVVVELLDNVSVYAEIMHIDSAFFGIGGRYRF